MSRLESRIAKLEGALQPEDLREQLNGLSELHRSYLRVFLELNRERGLMDERRLIGQFLAAVQRRAPGASLVLDIPGWNAELTMEFSARVDRLLSPPWYQA
jgi:hypothetical protein